jgi:hypothetical protein
VPPKEPPRDPHAYEDLPEHVRLFLEQLRPDDIASIAEGITLAKAAKMMGRFWKWIFITAVLVAGGAATISNSIDGILHKFRGGG